MMQRGKRADKDMTSSEKLGWQLSGLKAGMTVSLVLVVACFGMAIYFSSGIAESSGEDQALAVR